MPFSGPAVLFATAARTVLADEHDAVDYLERLRASGTWIDHVTGRLRIGAGNGRLPVAPLVQQAIEWGEYVLRPDLPEALATPHPPEGWDGAAAWREQRDAVSADVVKPALARWVELLGELLPNARSAEQPGLVHVPGGEEAYALCVQSATTLPGRRGDPSDRSERGGSARTARARAWRPDRAGFAGGDPRGAARVVRQSS